MWKSRFEQNFDDAVQLTPITETMLSSGLANIMKVLSNYERIQLHIVQLSLLSATAVLLEHSHVIQDVEFVPPTNLFTIIPSFLCKYIESYGNYPSYYFETHDNECFEHYLACER